MYWGHIKMYWGHINWLFIQEIRCSGATLGLWKGFQARSHMYTYERKAFLESKTLLKLIGLWTWGRVSLYKNLLLSLPLPRDIVIKQKPHKL